MTYWNPFVANLELHGVGTFFDARLDDVNQFPIAAKAGLGHVSVDPDSDRVTAKLPALHFYQLALPAPRPRPGNRGVTIPKDCGWPTIREKSGTELTDHYIEVLRKLGKSAFPAQ